MNYYRINKAKSHFVFIISNVLLSTLLTACSTGNVALDPIKPIFIVDNMQELMASINQPFIGFPTPNNYSICHDHTCSKTAFIHLSDSQWSTITALFSPPVNNAVQEREQIKRAISLFEIMSGEQAGTSTDRAENYVVNGVNGQLDCIDEATNTTVYLRMLSDSNLLLFHQQASRVSRGGLFSPHNTATIIETATHERFAVDSWFEDNGQPPAIIPLTLWKSGWKPKAIK